MLQQVKTKVPQGVFSVSRTLLAFFKSEEEPYLDLYGAFGLSFIAGRYHSLYAKTEKMPDVLEVTAICEDGIVMAVSDCTLPISAVQFHPETILSLPEQAGIRIMRNLMAMVNINAC